MERIGMRSENLQKYFVKEYERFFLYNNFVISAPHIIYRWCMIGKKNITPQIHQKIASKMFLWINSNANSEDIIFNTITYFSSSQKKFITVPLETIFADIDNRYFKENIRSKLAEFGYTKGIEINILSEDERWSGSEFCWIIPVILSASIHILTDKITRDQLHDINSDENSWLFTSISATALQLFPKTELDTYGAITHTVMTNHRLPLLSQEVKNIKNKKTKTAISHRDMQEYFHIKEIENQPMIDYGILNFWSSYDEHYINHISKTQNEIRGIGSYLNEKLVKAWGDILKHGHEERMIEDFINSIQQQGLFGACIENHDAVFADITSFFNQSKQCQDEKIGIMPLTSSKYWWSFLFVTKYKKSRETMERVFEKLQEIWHKMMHYQYLSRIDWFTTDGLQIEQDIGKDIYSSHIKDNNAILESSCGKQIIGSHRKLIEQIDNGIIFDTIDSKIYIDKKPTTYKQLMTQSGTIDVIQPLFERMWWYINNSELPPSSYSKNKNEMVGKIIWPLQELVQKKFHEKLDLKCKGSMINFDMSLTSTKTNLYLLKKIH